MMNNLITVRLGPKVHILIPWNDLHSQESETPAYWKSLGLKKIPAIYIPVNRG